MTDPDHANVRELWLRYELIHDIAYFSPVVLSHATALGMRGFWMGYFAMRSAPLGRVDPALVTATFFGFHHSRVRRALPDAWAYTSPEQALAARLAGVEEALAGIAGDQPLLEEAADLLWTAAQAADTAGRPLGAVYRSLDRPRSPNACLWLATAILCEHRGDGHNATLVAKGVAPAEAHQLKVAAGESDAETLRTGRGFPEREWQLGTDALVDRGWLNQNGQLTEEGHRAHVEIEATTDRLAVQPWSAVGSDTTARVLELLDPLAQAVVRSGLIPRLNPVGLVWDQE